MDSYLHRLLLSATISASVLLTGCATVLKERAYVKETLTRDAVTTQSLGSESDSLPSEVRKTYAARLTSGRYTEPASAFYNPDAANRNPEPLSDIETRAMMDVAVEFQQDEDNLVPAYRFIMTPYKKIAPQHVDAWRPMAVITLKKGGYASAMMVAPLPTVGQRLVNGQIVTPWTFCEVCFVSDNNGKRVATKNWTSKYRGNRISFLGDSIKSPHIGFASRTGLEKLRFMNADPHTNIGDAVFVSGAKAVQAARQAFFSRYEARNERQKMIYRHNTAYKNFLDKKYGAMHLAADLTKAGADCDDYRSTPNTNQSADYNQRFIEQNYTFIDCAQRVLQQYDLAGYAAMYPDFVQREHALWARTDGAKREKILSPEDMVEWGKGHVENAYTGIDKIQKYNNRKYADAARRQEKDRAFSAILAGMNQTIASMKADNRNRQREINRLQAQARRPRPAPVVNQNSQPTRKTQASAASVPSSEKSAAVQVSATSTSGSSIDAGVNASSAKTSQALQPSTAQVAVASSPQNIGAEALAGGEQGCVALIETNRYPGKSAMSSCTFGEPERKSLEMKFLNSCGVPVNVSIDLLYDTGTTKTSGEYNIKPGKTRATVGYCGATRYAYSYKETSESVRNRNE